MNFDQFRESERTGWHDRARGYGDATARATRQSIPTLLAHTRLQPGFRVLDAGCGPGYVAGCAQILGAQPAGIDFAPGMVAQAKVNFPNIPFHEGCVQDLPFDDGSFDAVISNIVLFHVTDPGRAMAEAHRVLDAGGTFAFSQWLGPAESPCYKMIFEVLGQHADMTLADPAPDAYALSDQSKVSQMMTSAGFEDLKFEVVPNVLHATGTSFFDFFMQFGVRVPLILGRQSEAARASIRAELDERAQEYRSDGGYEIPMPSLIISGRRAPK